VSKSSGSGAPCTKSHNIKKICKDVMEDRPCLALDAGFDPVLRDVHNSENAHPGDDDLENYGVMRFLDRYHSRGLYGCR